ncbi:MAG: aldehyde ferredoxin oxidoreductase family protein [Phycisphaerae bacterium]|jgi:aldehyde:ferredoxin oxidoreductase|nr:aldehyde ferredoxin oxidoreductase family protein [Phycisphaerae bacterium]
MTMQAFKGGYLGRTLRVNLTTRQTSVEELNDSELELLLGGRGIAARMYYQEIPAETKPFDEGNKLFFVTGPMTGVPLPSTTKFQLATKSPETGHYLCSNCGGVFGPQLKQCGFDALIVEGVASGWTYLTIREGQVEFCDAADLVGLSTTDAQSKLLELIDDKNAGTMTIGPAAEKLVRLSYIGVDSRAFGRGGPGAVMGSKKLKGIVVRGTGKTPVADKDRVDEIRKAALAELRTSRADHTRLGTMQYIKKLNDLGCMPTRNFQTSHFEECEPVEAEAMKADYYVRNYACYRCPVACGKVCEVKDGPHAGARARTEFETVGLFGPCCGVSDFGAIVAANQLADEIGLDTISVGNAVSLTMELYERGLITTDDTEGIEAKFGSGEALIEIIRLVGERRGIGDLLADGMAEVARRKPEWSWYCLHVKGMPFAAYDPRGFYGNALTKGTSSRGACHNVGGWSIRAELLTGEHDRFALEGKGPLIMSIQDNRAYVDSLGLCTVVRGSMAFSASPAGDTMEAVTGYGFTPKLLEIGERIYSLERMILNREGIVRTDDMLPDRIFKEAIPSGPCEGKTLTQEQYDFMLDEYYQARGWDSNGVVTDETKQRLGLTDVLLQKGPQEQ